MSKRFDRTGMLIGGGILLIAVVIVAGAMLMPRWVAQRTFQKQCNTLREAQDIRYLSLLDPREQVGPLSPEELEARLTDAPEIDAIRTQLLSVLTQADYIGAEEAINGNWDVRLRFGLEGKTIDFYLRESTIYLAKGSKRQVFRLKDAAAYAALREELLSLLGTAESE